MQTQNTIYGTHTQNKQQEQIFIMWLNRRRIEKAFMSYCHHHKQMTPNSTRGKIEHIVLGALPLFILYLIYEKKKYQNKKRPFFCLLFYPIIWCYCRSIDIWHCMAFGSETMHICITSTRVAQHSSVQKKKTFALNKCGWSPWEALLAISDVDVGYSEQRNHGPQRLNSFVWSHRCDIREKKRGASFIQYLP